MEVTRSIGYVQIYFGIFIILCGLSCGILAAIQSSSIDYNYRSEIDYENFEELPTEEKIFLRQQEQFVFQIQHNSNNHITQLITKFVLAMIILISLGVHATLHGIIHTRKGKPEDIHPKKKLLHNIIYAILLSVAMLLLIYMIIA